MPGKNTPQPAPRFPSTSDLSGRRIGPEELEAVTRVLGSGALCRTVGTEAAGLEEEFARMIGSAHAVASSSGTAALHLAVFAVGLEAGDEVIVPPITDFGTVAGILAQNGIPVFADVDPVSGCLTAETVVAAITPRTRAVIAVHLFGGAAPVREIIDAVRPSGIVVIEDCAQAYLTVPDGGDAYAGTIGDIGCFSLQQSKHITAGDGGLTITDDAALARRMTLFADKGWPRDTGERTHLFPGLNYRMTELQAAVTRAQLPKLAGVVADRRRSATKAISALADLPGLHLPTQPDRHGFWMLPLVLVPGVLNIGCRDFAAALAERGVPAIGGYLDMPLHLTPAVRDRAPFGAEGPPFSVPPASREIAYREGDAPLAEDMVARTLLVIVWNENYIDEHVEHIVQAVRAVHDGALAVADGTAVRT
ncbi:perosamine synthetase [Microbacterium sp. W4I4]|uniref:DegT/DnrJ/EryC1/StrS family aminotransferase n=1 Tax=Microbacterium sp. W4I4 TaxID=3042295 RepID=UPI002789DA7C|nr:DegT/DnrJ/EryC1/StrS family aminotransferase [Microbacterium sp. W4I4]MDQ0615342.1 perosamine synthetase [Microbacterium sp. W4I4]